MADPGSKVIWFKKYLARYYFNEFKMDFLFRISIYAMYMFKEPYIASFLASYNVFTSF